MITTAGSFLGLTLIAASKTFESAHGMLTIAPLLRTHTYASATSFAWQRQSRQSVLVARTVDLPSTKLWIPW